MVHRDWRCQHKAWAAWECPLSMVLQSPKKTWSLSSTMPSIPASPSSTPPTSTAPLPMKSSSERFSVSVSFVVITVRFGFLNIRELMQGLKGGIRDKVELATKFGISLSADGKTQICGDPAYVRASCEASLKRLDIHCIDLYYQHRIDNRVPIEVTVRYFLTFLFFCLIP